MPDKCLFKLLQQYFVVIIIINNNNSSYCLEGESPSIKTSGNCLPGVSSFSLFCLFKRRHGEFEQGYVLSESYTATDILSPILPACCQLLLLACVFITRDTVHHPRRFFFFRQIWLRTDLFVMRGIREPRFHCTLLPFQRDKYD
jgi:hypothetical protein